MRYLYPGGGILPDGMYGYITQPRRWSRVGPGYIWAADNDQYSGATSIDEYLDWLDILQPMSNACLFATAPDVVGNVLATLGLYRFFARHIKSLGYPVALVAQDGLESMRWPEDYDALFVGGSTEWKLSEAAIWCIKKAQQAGKHIHIGRINSNKRYKHFRLLEGSDKFTCDGTKIHFAGTTPTIKEWRKHEKQPPLFRFSVLAGNSAG